MFLRTDSCVRLGRSIALAVTVAAAFGPVELAASNPFQEFLEARPDSAEPRGPFRTASRSRLADSLAPPGMVGGRVTRDDRAEHYSSHSLAFDSERRLQAAFPEGPICPHCVWTWQLLPDGLLYKSYLAGTKEPRIGSAWLHEDGIGWIWDVTLGGRVGIARFGTQGSIQPEGWQLDIEGAAFPRLNMEEGNDLDSADFRFGVPLTWSQGPYEMKLAYYHISAHVGDEFLVRNPGFQRVNYVRDAIVLGLGWFVVPDVRLYSEAAWSFSTDGGAEPWELQFGAEYSPVVANGLRGTPFAAVGGHLFEEHDFGGYVNLMAGWQWRGAESDRLLRAGLQYFNGKSSQFAFFDEHQELIGIGVWFDY